MNGIAFKSSACDDLLETSLASSQFSSADQHLILQGWGGSCCFPSYYSHNPVVLKHLLSRCVSIKDMFQNTFILVLWLLIFFTQVFQSSAGLYCVLSRLRYLQAFKPCRSLSNYGFISAHFRTQVWAPSLSHSLLLMIYSDLCSQTWCRSPLSMTSSHLSLITSPERHDVGTCFPYLKNG